MHQESQRVGPVSLSERILFIDVLRGMALFGILAANMRAFVAPLDAYGDIGLLFHSRADVLAQAFIDWFFQGKFISIFSFLFGLGFAIQLSRAETRGVRFLKLYPRRLLALALFGIIHGILIWSGDILLRTRCPERFYCSFAIASRRRCCGGPEVYSRCHWWWAQLSLLSITATSDLIG